MFLNMVDTLMGIKVKMSQAFDKNNARVPVTLVLMTPNIVTDIKSVDRDGYEALQIGIGKRKLKNTSKPLAGHLKKVTKENILPRKLKEIKTSNTNNYKIGDEIKLSHVFVAGDTIEVTATSKGKGFAGGMKRWGFSGGPKTHGQSDRSRAPGSIGQGTTPGRVHKGKKMAGRMGSDRVTIKNLSVLEVNDEKNILSVVGPIPGTKGSFVFVKRTSPMQEKPLVEEKIEETNEEVKIEEKSNE